MGREIEPRQGRGFLQKVTFEVFGITIESHLKLFAVSQANVESGSVADEFVRIQVGHEAGESQA
jgi:hypothetical protein